MIRMLIRCFAFIGLCLQVTLVCEKTSVQLIKNSLALLIDRIEIREGRKQRYGSQIGTNPNNKTLYVLPLIDPDNVDKRRAEVGLGPISEYVKNWNLVWDVEKYKSELPELEKLNR